MASKLTNNELVLVKSLKNAEVLQDLDPHLLDQRDGIIIVACADGDYFFDLFSHHARTQIHRTDPRMHTFGWHGGALACAPCSPVNPVKRADDVFMRQIADARSLKDIHLVGLYAHMPCGAVRTCGIPMEKALALQVRAYARVKAVNHGIKVACFLHVDYGRRVGGGKNFHSYYFSPEKWERWAQQHNVQPIV